MRRLSGDEGEVYKRQVYSHPQALMQCSDFFDEHKDINQVAVRNTAFSAKKVKDDGDITQAGICLLYTSVADMHRLSQWRI